MKYDDSYNFFEVGMREAKNRETLEEINHYVENSYDEIENENAFLKLYNCKSFEELKRKLLNRTPEVTELIEFLESRG